MKWPEWLQEVKKRLNSVSPERHGKWKLFVFMLLCRPMQGLQMHLVLPAAFHFAGQPINQPSNMPDEWGDYAESGKQVIHYPGQVGML